MTPDQVGGRHLAAADLIRSVASRGVQLAAVDGRLVFRAPPGALTQPLRERLSELRGEVLAQLAGGPPEVLELSDRQMRLWLLDRRHGASPGYHLGAAFRLTGALDIKRLRAAVQEVVDRVAVLRAVVCEVDGVPALVAVPGRRASVSYVDIRGAGEDMVRQTVTETVAAPIDLGTGPLLRVVVACRAADQHIVVIAVHHIVADDHSVRLIAGEVLHRYAWPGAAQEAPSQVVAARVPATVWPAEADRDRLVRARCEALRPVARPVLPAPADRDGVSVWSARSAVIRLAAPQRRAWDECRRRLGVTTLGLTLAMFGLSVAGAGGPRSLLIGVPAAGRRRPEQWREIGYFATTTVAHVAVDPAARFGAFVTAVTADLRESVEVQHVPYEDIVGDRSHSDVGGHVLWAVTYADEQPRTVGSLLVEGVEHRDEQARHDLRCAVVQGTDGIAVELVHRPSTVDQGFAGRVAAALGRLYTAVPRADTPLGTVLADLAGLAPVRRLDPVAARTLRAAAARRRRAAHGQLRGMDS